MVNSSIRLLRWESFFIITSLKCINVKIDDGIRTFGDFLNLFYEFLLIETQTAYVPFSKEVPRINYFTHKCKVCGCLKL